MSNIGLNIKILREMRGLSVEELAKRVHKSRATLYRYESGDIRQMPVSAVTDIAAALDVDPAAIMGWIPIEVVSVADAKRAQESRLLYYFDNLDPQQKVQMISLAKSLSKGGDEDE